MPRPVKNPIALSPGQASYVLDRLMSERRVSQSEVQRLVRDMNREINELEQKLQRLRDAQGVGGGAATRRSRGRRAAEPEAAAGSAKRTRSAAKALTPEQRASRQLQGRYLGLVRQFPASKRPHFSRIAKEKGREAAIKEMLEAKK